MQSNYSIDWRACSLLAAAAMLLVATSASATVLDKTKDVGGTVVHYKVVLPNGYDPAKAYLAVLAFPGGPQTMQMVEGTLQRNWLLAQQLGYIVIVPAAPGGRVFFEEGDKVFPEFIVKLLADYKVLNNKLHIAGVSNGGLSAFHIAASYPQYFLSVTGLPGYLPDATPERVRAIAGMCISMFAGEKDTGWLNAEKRQAAAFRALGISVQFSEEKGEGHVMRTLDGEGANRLFQQFAQARQGCGK